MKRFASFVFLLSAAIVFQGVFAVDEIKTISYFVGQATGPSSSVNWPFVFYIGDDIVSTKSAFFEISGTSGPTANLGIELGLAGGSGSCVLTRTLDTSGRNNEFRLLYDVTSCINADAKGDYSRALTIALTGGSADTLSANFFLTYQHPPPANSGVTAMKTISFGADEGTAPASITAGSNGTLNFSFYIGDNITSLKSAFFEINGISLSSPASSLALALGGGNGTCPLSSVLDTGGRENQFSLLYDVLSCINAPAKGSYSRSITLTPSNADVYIHSAKLTLTYEFTPPASGGYPVSGTLISPTFDTGTANGSSFNWILWRGLLNNGMIRLQLATSNCPNGETNAPACTTGGWGSGSNYLGPDCTTSTFYTQAATELPQEINCPAAHNNKRYFRYKAILCSADCSSAGNATPQVDDIIVNWSP